MRYNLTIIFLLAFPSMGVGWQCESEAIGTRFNEGVEVTVQNAEVKGQDLRFLTIAVPTKIENVVLSSVMFDQANEQGRLLTANLSLESQGALSQTQVLITPGQLDVSSFRVSYIITPVYPDACHYTYTVPAKHNKALKGDKVLRTSPPS